MSDEEKKEATSPPAEEELPIQQSASDTSSWDDKTVKAPDGTKYIRTLEDSPDSE